MVNRHSFILIRQMVALVRRALAEVCTVPVLVVIMLQLNRIWLRPWFHVKIKLF